MWFFLVHNSPSTHPRICLEERHYIEKILNKKDNAKVENTLFSAGKFTRVRFYALSVPALFLLMLLSPVKSRATVSGTWFTFTFPNLLQGL